ncbi:GNAT family N-acetyltransferase [Rhizobium sp. 768_B6_N1_8]|uniref:GNAT family N-acetyltransferase n=1 Tax=unclassified Rhizobium TaxID=2613769 RepID=UPI003F28F3AA
MVRKAILTDVPALKAVRSSVVENILSDPTKITDDDYDWYIANPGVAVWEEDGEIVGFSAAAPRDGNIWALFVVPDFEGNGIGSTLLAEACACLLKHLFPISRRICTHCNSSFRDQRDVRQRDRRVRSPSTMTSC